MERCTAFLNDIVFEKLFNAQISAILKAGDTKFGMQAFVYPTQIKLFLNFIYYDYTKIIFSDL